MLTLHYVGQANTITSTSPTPQNGTSDPPTSNHTNSPQSSRMINSAKIHPVSSSAPSGGDTSHPASPITQTNVIIIEDDGRPANFGASFNNAVIRRRFIRNVCTVHVLAYNNLRSL